MSDWAEEKAREWIHTQNHDECSLRDPKDDTSSLAALLREVAKREGDEASGIWSHRMSEARAEAREQTLAEARRVVEERKTAALDNAKKLAAWDGQADESRCRELAALYCDEILYCLDNLTPSKSKDNL